MTDSDRPPDFGSRMRRLREQRGVSLRDIAERTKISVTTLEALEKNDIARMPGGIFSRAIVRAYAHEIGADPEPCVADFIGQVPLESTAVGTVAERGQAGRRWLIAAMIVVPLAAILVWSFLVLR